MLQLASQQDWACVNALARQVHELHVSWRPDIYRMPEMLYPMERFEQEIRQRNLYVAKVDDSVVGYVLLKVRNCDAPALVSRRVMIIDEFCVEESLRGHGFGKEMARDVQVLAKAFRCTDLQLGVYPQNDEAVGFWQKCGFMIRSIEMQKKV